MFTVIQVQVFISRQLGASSLFIFLERVTDNRSDDNQIPVDDDSIPFKASTREIRRFHSQKLALKSQFTHPLKRN